MNFYRIIANYYCRTLHFHLGKEDFHKNFEFKVSLENGNNKSTFLFKRSLLAADILHVPYISFPYIR